MDKRQYELLCRSLFLIFSLLPTKIKFTRVLYTEDGRNTYNSHMSSTQKIEETHIISSLCFHTSKGEISVLSVYLYWVNALYPQRTACCDLMASDLPF